MNKKAKNSDEAQALQEKYKGQPHGWIQWKGTDACLDFHCKCGAHLHFDETFLYHVKCGECNSYYMLSGYVEAIEIEEAPDRVCEGVEIF